MTTYKLIIVDDTLIGDALYCSFKYVNATMETRNEHFAIKLLPERGKNNTIYNDITKEIIIDEASTSILFINDTFYYKLETRSSCFGGLDIIEFIRLHTNCCNKVINIYSFKDLSSHSLDNKFIEYMNIPGHFYFKMPFNVHELIETSIQFCLNAASISDPRQHIYNERASFISGQFIRAFKHEIVDKLLPSLIKDGYEIRSSKFIWYSKPKIMSLFSDRISQLVGCEMKNIYANEYSLLNSALIKFDDATPNHKFKELEIVSNLLKTVLNRFDADNKKAWNEEISYESEKEYLYLQIDALAILLKKFWEINISELTIMQLEETVKTLKAPLAEYFTHRLEIEITLWRLALCKVDQSSIRRMMQIMSQLLDPLIDRLALNKYSEALQLFDSETLKMINMPGDFSFKALMKLGD